MQLEGKIALISRGGGGVSPEEPEARMVARAIETNAPSIVTHPEHKAQQA